MFGDLRSSQHADGSHPVETVATHQVGNVVLEFHLLPGESSSLKQLSSGKVVVLVNDTNIRTSVGGNGMLFTHLTIVQNRAVSLTH